LASLKERNETAYYRMLLGHLEEMCPVVYTPTVGEACQKFGHLWRSAEGIYLSHHYRGRIRKLLDEWPHKDVGIVVVTDGSRILGLGDLGANGMGIPVGKLALYVVGAGFHPATTLPVLLDVGTNNQKLLNDPVYMGEKNPRLTGAEYYSFLDEFILAVKDKWPHAVLQFEDFSNDHCFELLDQYRNKVRCFNDDIQGTGAVVTSGFINAVKLSGVELRDHRIVFLGAGSAAVGVASQIMVLFEEAGMSKEEARRHFYICDSKGLITSDREHLETHKIDWARQDYRGSDPVHSLSEVIAAVKPTALIGLSGQGGAFTVDMIKLMAQCSARPIIFALSNPTKNSECDAQSAYEFTQGRCIFASGSPFNPVSLEGKIYYPAQGNNMYIFPGLGYGAWLCQAVKITDTMINAASRALANCTTQEDLAQGRIYPPLSKIREISAQIAADVYRTAVEEGLAQLEMPKGDLIEYVKRCMYIPEYVPFHNALQAHL
jgi:malate dehydrogenase (oxaloacetate-decarboxylating)(NADP+)